MTVLQWSVLGWAALHPIRSTDYLAPPRPHTGSWHRARSGAASLHALRLQALSSGSPALYFLGRCLSQMLLSGEELGSLSSHPFLPHTERPWMLTQPRTSPQFPILDQTPSVAGLWPLRPGSAGGCGHVPRPMSWSGWQGLGRVSRGNSEDTEFCACTCFLVEAEHQCSQQLRANETRSTCGLNLRDTGFKPILSDSPPWMRC